MNNFDKLEKLYPNSFKSQKSIVIQHSGVEAIVSLTGLPRKEKFSIPENVELSAFNLFEDAPQHREVIGELVTNIANELELNLVIPESENLRADNKLQFISKKAKTMQYLLEIEMNSSTYAPDDELREIINKNLDVQYTKLDPGTVEREGNRTMVFDTLAVFVEVMSLERAKAEIDNRSSSIYCLLEMNHSENIVRHARDTVSQLIEPLVNTDVSPVKIRTTADTTKFFYPCLNSAYCISVEYSRAKSAVSEIDVSLFEGRSPLLEPGFAAASNRFTDEHVSSMSGMYNSSDLPSEIDSTHGLLDDKFVGLMIPAHNLNETELEFKGFTTEVKFVPTDRYHPNKLVAKRVPDITSHITERFDDLTFFNERSIIGALVLGNNLRLTVITPAGYALIYIVPKEDLKDYGFERLVEAYDRVGGVARDGGDLLIPTSWFTGYVK